MSASPGATAVTMPVEDTVATPTLEDSQVAWFVTVCVLLFDMTAVAVNCDVSPGFAEEAGAVTVTEVTVGAAGVLGVVGVPLLPPQLIRPNIVPTVISAMPVRPTRLLLGQSKGMVRRAKAAVKLCGISQRTLVLVCARSVFSFLATAIVIHGGAFAIP
jgi:hypothetical protein